MCLNWTGYALHSSRAAIPRGAGVDVEETLTISLHLMELFNYEYGYRTGFWGWREPSRDSYPQQDMKLDSCF